MNLIGRVAECRELKRLKESDAGLMENDYTREDVNGVVTLNDLF